MAARFFENGYRIVIRVLFFGPVAECADARQMQFDFQPGLCLQDVVTQLAARFPKAFDIVCFIAVNNEQARDMRLPLKDEDEIAFMAKFSGG